MMAFTGVQDIAEFRSQLVAWLDENDLTPPADPSLDAGNEQHARVLGALYDAGWMRRGWPKSVGGLGGPTILHEVVVEEIVGRGLDDPGRYSLLEVLISAMVHYAPSGLAAKMVPRLLSGRETWCQGFSAREFGDDLASLPCHAEKRGGEWVIKGKETWTSLARYASRCILLTRTGPGDTGITAFLVDMDSPGVDVRPPVRTHGVEEICEVRFDDVAVPVDRMLGNPGDGWQLAMRLGERSTCSWRRIAYLYSRFDALVADVQNIGQAADSDMGATYLALHTLRCRSRSTQHRLADGQDLGPQTWIDEVLLSGAERQLYDTARDLLPGVIELDDTPWRTEYLCSRTVTIEDGTAEAQRDVIARDLLHLGAEKP